MMEFFRGRLFKGIVMWFMALVFAVMFGMVVAGLNPRTLFTGGVDWVMRVEGVPIDVQSYQEAMRRASEEAQRAQRLGQNVDVEAQAQDNLIQRTLLVSKAREMKIVPDAKELHRAVKRDPKLAEAFRPYALAFTSAQAINTFAQDQAVQGIIQTLQNLPLVTDAEIEQDFIERNTKAKLRFLEFPYIQYETAVDVSEEEMRRFYDENQDLFRRGLAVDVEFVKLEPSAVRDTITISDEDVEAYYEQRSSEFSEEQVHARHILFKVPEDATPEEEEAIRKRAEEVLELAKKPDADFEALAREYSEGPTGPNGGDLGWFGRGAMVPAFERAAFSMRTPGEISDLVRTNYGFHIIQFVERRTYTKPIGQVRAQIENTLRTARAVEKAREDADELFFDLDAEGIEKAIQMERYKPYKLEVKSTGYFTRNDTTIENVGPAWQYRDFIEKAFLTRVGEWSEPVEVKQAYNNEVLGYFLLRVKDRKPPEIASFDEVKDDIEAILKRRKAADLAEAAAARLWAEYEQGEDLDALLKKYKPREEDKDTLEVRESGEFATSPTGYIPMMGTCKPAMVAAFQMEVGEVRGVFKGQSAAYIIELAERKDADLSQLTAAERANIRSRLLRTKGGAAFNVWYETIREQAEIERNEDLLARF